jgi:hypothetical protein
MRDNLSSYYQNCGVEADAEMLEIDAMEDSIAPLDDNTVHIAPMSIEAAFGSHSEQKS